MIKSDYVWSVKAKGELDIIMLYVSKKFGNAASQKLKNQVDDLIEKIRVYSKLCPASKQRNYQIRRCVINKQTSLSYVCSDERIFILSIYGNRTNHWNY